MKNLTEKEVTTILAGLRYLQANWDDAKEATADLDYTDGTETFLLTPDEIDVLCEEINMDGHQPLPPSEQGSTVKLYLAFVEGKIKGILTAKEYMANTEPYWDELRPIDVLLADWNAGKVNVATIHKYL